MGGVLQGTEPSAGGNMIEFNCIECAEDMEAPQSLAGQAVTCPQCGAMRRVPPIQTEASVTAPDPLPELSQPAAPNVGRSAGRPQSTQAARPGSPPQRSQASFVWGWGLIAGGIILWLISYAVVAHTASKVKPAQLLAEEEIGKVDEKWNAELEKDYANEREYNRTMRMFSSERAALGPTDPGIQNTLNDVDEAARRSIQTYRESLIMRHGFEVHAIVDECDKKIAQIERTGGYITLPTRICAGLIALAGIIMVSYWLGTGGTRSGDIRLD
jgi:hypothetical protein